MARDNFLLSIINKLRLRVSGRCSNPECRVPTTSASSKNEEHVNSIGIAAHICAASPGGPRYSSKMSPKERKSINNALWLCSNCSIKIDRDVHKYTVEVLNEWKKAAELSAVNEIGKKLPENNDAINTVSAALTGYPKSFLATAISNVIKASEQSLEALDPRFTVRSSHKDNLTTFEIFANEAVNMSVKINPNYVEEYSNKFKQLTEHGEDLEISSDAITFEGSKLIEEITKQSKKGKMKIPGPQKKGVQKLWLVNKNTSVVETFEDITGNIQFGNKSLCFKGTSCNNIFSFEYSKLYNKDKATFTISLNFTTWEGRDIRHLPYFSKIFSLFEKLADGWELFTSLEVDGIKILNSIGVDASKTSIVTEIRPMLNYIDKVSKIAVYLNLLINFTPNFSYSHDEIRELSDINKIIHGEYLLTRKEVTSNVSCELVADKDANNIKAIENITTSTSIKLNENTHETLECFGHTIELPLRNISINNVIPKVHNSNKKIKQGDAVRVEFIPAIGFEYKIEYSSADL